MIFVTHGLRGLRRLFDGARPDRVSGWQVAAALLLILGAKLVLIGLVANPVPFWDQWFAEGEQLYLPYLQHGLSGPSMFAAHNEHRILFTRLLLLALLEICGNWNTLAAMVAGAFIHVAALGSLAYGLRRAILPAPLLPTAMLIAVFAVPFGNENTLWGFQSANYFAILLGIWSVVLITPSRAFGSRWWLGYSIGAVSIFAMAAAGTALAAAGLIVILQIALGARQRTHRDILSVLILVGTGAVLLAIIPHPPGYLSGRPTSLAGFAWSLGLAGGWPVTLPAAGPALLYLPTLYLTWLLYRNRIGFDDHAWRVVALAGWVALQAAGTAYARYSGPIASRYIDTLGLGCVVNACAIGVIVHRGFAQPPSWLRPTAAVWIASIVGCLSFQAVYFFPRAQVLDPRSKEAQIANISSYLVAGRFGYAGQLPYSQTYNDLPRLAQVVDQPLVRGLLPPELGSTPSERAAARQHLAFKGGLELRWQVTARVSTIAGIALLLAGSWLYVFLGLAWPARRAADNNAAPGSSNSASYSEKRHERAE